MGNSECMNYPSVAAAGQLLCSPLKSNQDNTLPFPDINNSINRSICESKHGTVWVEEQRKESKEVKQRGRMWVIYA